MLKDFNIWLEGRLTNMITFGVIGCVGIALTEFNHMIIGVGLILFAFVLAYGTMMSIQSIKRQRRYDAHNYLVEKDMQALSEYHEFISTSYTGTEEQKQSELLKIQEEAIRLKNSLRHI